jgi:hypothetical protein
MLVKTTIAYQNALEYARNNDGSWTAAFRGPFQILVTADSLERCRNRALDELDARLAEWIAMPVTGESDPLTKIR